MKGEGRRFKGNCTKHYRLSLSSQHGLTPILSDSPLLFQRKRDPVSARFGGPRAAFPETRYTHPNLEFRLRVVGALAEAKAGELPVDYALDLFLSERTQPPAARSPQTDQRESQPEDRSPAALPSG
jgi:hypothetical protein